jgi:large subunit ribosomal protein L18
MNTIKTAQKHLRKRRQRRINRVRTKVNGTGERPRLVVHRTNRHFHVQAIDDTDGRTVLAASTQAKELREKFQHGGNIPAAVEVARILAERAKEKGVTKLAFDKRWYRYHGRVKAFAEALRKAGMQF